MRMDYIVVEALENLGRERGIPVENILEALANALVSAYKRSPGAAEEARVTIARDDDGLEIIIYAQELDAEGNVVREWEDTPGDFGRIAASTAKQVMSHLLRQTKRDLVFAQYEGQKGDLVTGTVQQHDHRATIIDLGGLGGAEAIMPGSERIPFERLERGARVKALIVEVNREAKGAQVVVSRSDRDLVRRLLEIEVPELMDGTVQVKSIARDAGHRTKIAVFSSDPNVDPKGACVGAQGRRVRNVVNELRGEKVDVVQWHEDPALFIIESLGPAKVRDVRVNREERMATVIVSEHQLSLAIGRDGQNARLAARLTGYKIDIQSDASRTKPAAPPPVPGPPPEAVAPAPAPAALPATEEPSLAVPEAPPEAVAPAPAPVAPPAAEEPSVAVPEVPEVSPEVASPEVSPPAPASAAAGSDERAGEEAVDEAPSSPTASDDGAVDAVPGPSGKQAGEDAEEEAIP